jgi:pimeloyl-ACP methyl ester carboxylesterase
MPSSKSVVIAHGVSVDGSCFSRLIPPLRPEGHEVLASQHGSRNHQGDIDRLRCMSRATRRFVLVNHSWGGALITAASTDGRVCGLVCIAALGPDAEKTSSSGR